MKRAHLGPLARKSDVHALLRPPALRLGRFELLAFGCNGRLEGSMNIVGQPAELGSVIVRHVAQRGARLRQGGLAAENSDLCILQGFEIDRSLYPFEAGRTCLLEPR